MSTAPKLLLAVTAIVAAMTLGTGNAKATAAVEVVDEGTGLHCSVLPITVCEVHIFSVAPFVLYFHAATSEAAISLCTTEFDALILGDGDGALVNQVLSGEHCHLEPCDEPAPSHADHEWPIKIGELFPGHEVMGVTFCFAGLTFDPIEEGEDGLQCEAVLDMVNGGPTAYEFETNGVPCLEAGSIEVDGSWETEGDATEVEVFHE